MPRAPSPRLEAPDLLGALLLRGKRAEGPGGRSAQAGAARGCGSIRRASGPLSREPDPRTGPAFCWRPLAGPGGPAPLRMNPGDTWGHHVPPPGPLNSFTPKGRRWRRRRGTGRTRDARGAEARGGLAGSGRADGRLSCQGPGLATQTASFLYGNEEFRLMELNHL